MLDEALEQLSITLTQMQNAYCFRHACFVFPESRLFRLKSVTRFLQEIRGYHRLLVLKSKGLFARILVSILSPQEPS
jgi:hypothetical protein